MPEANAHSATTPSLAQFSMNSGFRKELDVNIISLGVFPARRAARKISFTRVCVSRVSSVSSASDGSATRSRAGAFGSSARPLIDAPTRASSSSPHIDSKNATSSRRASSSSSTGGFPTTRGGGRAGPTNASSSPASRSPASRSLSLSLSLAYAPSASMIDVLPSSSRARVRIRRRFVHIFIFVICSKVSTRIRNL